MAILSPIQQVVWKVGRQGQRNTISMKQNFKCEEKTICLVGNVLYKSMALTFFLVRKTTQYAAAAVSSCAILTLFSETIQYTSHLPWVRDLWTEIHYKLWLR